MALWNARHLCAAGVSAKRAWLAEQVEVSRPTVVVLCEVDGAFVKTHRVMRMSLDMLQAKQ